MTYLIEEDAGKFRNHGEAVYDGDVEIFMAPPHKLVPTLMDNLFNWITNMQNEVHKTAIEYHRKLRDKGMTKSKLDDIQGIGEKKRTALLKKFKTVKNIKEATIEELCSVSGINQDLAQKLKNEL